MNKLLIILLFFLTQTSFSQEIDEIFINSGEIYFSFEYKNKKELDKLSKIISLDHKITFDTAFAYANKKEFQEFIKQGIPYKIIPRKQIIFEETSKNNWNYYPSYNDYENIMQAFADSFPNICKLHNIGTLSSGRKILIAQISDTVGKKENEPSFLYTSSMHGDELAGYVMMLQLIETLLNNYGTNTRLTNLINQIDIWINPLANPDGAYAGGNQNVWGATRYNSNWVDLNRNYPDPQDGPHPDGNIWQEETIIFMGLSDTINFSLSSNLHGGTELVNYPWDTWGQLTADNDWWEYVSREYADSCQTNGSSGYFNSQNNGVVNGYDWYEVDGGRQDYMNYFKHCREFTLELSNDKTPYYWNANYPSLINYLEQSLYGVRGIITDSITGEPIKAKIEISGHDIDSSHIYSTLPIGNYHRYLYQGNYNITFSKSGYHSKSMNCIILNNQSTVQNVELVPINTSLNKNVISNNGLNKLQFDLIGRKIKKPNIILNRMNKKN